MSSQQRPGIMPHGHDRYDIVITLVTLAGTEYYTPANLTHYEDLAQLEDDIVSFLPTVSDIGVFGSEADLFEPDTQLPLSEDFHTALLQRNKLQIIIRPCMEEGHSVWQFQDSDREGYPKAVRVPINARKEVADRAFYAAPMLRHVEVVKHIGFAAWQSCQQLQIVKLPLSVVSLEDGVFQGCHVLKEVVASECVQFSRRVFAECCSLYRVGIGSDIETTNDLAPGAQLGPFAFESCLTLTSINFVMDQTNRSRTLPDGSFCGAGIESLCLPCDFRDIGPKACENCKRLVEVNLMCTEITAIWKSTFAHCVALADIWLPPKLQRIGKEAFLCCTSLRELVIPTQLRYLGFRAFCGCEQLALFTLLDCGDFERTIQTENNAFLMCDNFERASWVELLPPGDPDSDAFDEELHTELP